MQTLIAIFLFTPWTLVFLLWYKLLHRTRPYGNLWCVTRKYLDSFDGTKPDVETQDLVVVKEVEGEPEDVTNS